MRSRGFELPESPFGPPDVYDPALRGQRSRNAGQRIAPQDEPLGTTEDHYRKRLEAFVRSGKDVRKPETTRSMKALRARVRAMRDYNRFVR